MGGSVRSFKAFKCCGLSIKAVQFLGRAYRWHVVTGRYYLDSILRYGGIFYFILFFFLSFCDVDYTRCVKRNSTRSRVVIV